MNDNLEKFKEIIQKPDVVLLKKDLRKIAKEYQITRKNLIKKINKNGYEYDRKAKGYICLNSNTEVLRNDYNAFYYSLEKVEKMNVLLLEKLSESNKTKTYENDVIEVEANLVANKNWNYVASNLKADKKLLEEYDKVCKERLKGLKKQEITSIMINQFIKQYK